MPRQIKNKIKHIMGIHYGSTDNDVIFRVDSKIVNVAIHAGGGLGDFIVYSAIIDQLKEKTDCIIYIFTLYTNAAETILNNRKNVHVFHQLNGHRNNAFDLALELDHFVQVREINVVALKQKSPLLYDMAIKIMEYNKKNFPITDTVNDQRYIIINRTKHLGLNRWTQLSCSGVFEMASMTTDLGIGNNKTVLIKNKLINTAYITLHCGAARDMGGMQQTKVWPPHRMEEFVQLFKEKYKDIKVVQVAMGNEPHINGIDCLIHNADYEDLKVVLHHSHCHIASEGGTVHIASHLGTKCIVVFGPTPVHYYGYPRNENIVSPLCANCMEVIPDWYKKCAKGYETARCMEAITGKMIIEAFEIMLHGRNR